MASDQHIDRVARDPLYHGDRIDFDLRLLGRYRSVEHPDIGGQERNGSATYVLLSEPHDDADCPFGPGPVHE